MTRTYRKWDSMIARCYRPSHPAYKYYGAKGIQVCQQWRHSFKAFLSDMGEAPGGYWIDRIDNTKGYEPGNVRWVTPSESAKNRKQREQVAGSIRQQARQAGVSYGLVINRMVRGWTIEQALTIPIQSRGGMKHFDKKRLGLI